MSNNEKEAKPVMTPVGDIELDGRPFQLAKNGNFCLVRPGGRDVYDKVWHEAVRIEELAGDQKLIQGLLDSFGELWMANEAKREELEELRQQYDREVNRITEALQRQ